MELPSYKISWDHVMNCVFYGPDHLGGGGWRLGVLSHKLKPKLNFPKPGDSGVGVMVVNIPWKFDADTTNGSFKNGTWRSKILQNLTKIGQKSAKNGVKN